MTHHNVEVPIYKRGGGGVEFLYVPSMLTFDILELFANTCPHDEFERRVIGPGGHAGLIEFLICARGQELSVSSLVFIDPTFAINFVCIRCTSYLYLAHTRALHTVYISLSM